MAYAYYNVPSAPTIYAPPAGPASGVQMTFAPTSAYSAGPHVSTALPGSPSRIIPGSQVVLSSSAGPRTSTQPLSTPVRANISAQQATGLHPPVRYAGARAPGDGLVDASIGKQPLPKAAAKPNSEITDFRRLATVGGLKQILEISRDFDGYVGMFANGGQPGLSEQILKCVHKCLVDDNVVSLDEAVGVVRDFQAKHIGAGISRDERWTWRYAVASSAWEPAAMDWLRECLRDAPLLDESGKLVSATEAKSAMLEGPAYEVLKSLPADASNLVNVDGMMLDKDILLACHDALLRGKTHSYLDSLHKHINALGAIKVFEAAADHGVYTRTERWTIRFVLCTFRFTCAARHFLVEALAEMPHSDAMTA